MDAGLSAQDHGANELERQVEDAKRSVRMIEARVIATTERRLDALESQLAANAPSPAQATPADPPPEAAAWDVSAILDRLYALEMSQEREAATRETERGEVPPPASPAAP
jgi:hypothetical protein